MSSVSAYFTKAGYQAPKTRLGVDMNFGHNLCPTAAVVSSITKFTDQIPQTRITDAYAPHCLHSTAAGVGSFTTFTDQLQTFRFLDTLTCGDKSAMGSLTSFAGG